MNYGGFTVFLLDFNCIPHRGFQNVFTDDEIFCKILSLPPVLSVPIQNIHQGEKKQSKINNKKY